MNKYKTIDIHCHICGRHVGTYDGRSTSNYIARCNKCRKRVVYCVGTGKIEVKEIPQRSTSSGVSFV